MSARRLYHCGRCWYDWTDDKPARCPNCDGREIWPASNAPSAGPLAGCLLFVLLGVFAGAVAIVVAGCGGAVEVSPGDGPDASPDAGADDCENPAREGLACDDGAGRCQALACCLACYRPAGAHGPSACVPCADGGS